MQMSDNSGKIIDFNKACQENTERGQKTQNAPDTLKRSPAARRPSWYDGKNVLEADFCEWFQREYQLVRTGNAFFTPEGWLADESQLKKAILEELRPYVLTGLKNKINSTFDLLKIIANTDDLRPQPDRIHLANGTLFLNGSFSTGWDEIVRNRLPVSYNPDAAMPEAWLSFLSQLLCPEDIMTLQEYVGYCLIPTNKAQRMMLIKGSGGEGKSQIGVVLFRLFGSNARDGSVSKISAGHFDMAELEHCLLMIDDDMQMEALRKTDHIKSLVTAQVKKDLEQKGKRSHQGWMYTRILAFSNGDPQSLYDQSDGFYRRLLILTTKEKPADRHDDPDLAEKLCAELEGIFLWAFDGLQRLAANSFRFTESERTKANRETVKRDANNIITFLEATGFIRLAPGLSATSKELYAVYCVWCDENAMNPLSSNSFIKFLKNNERKYGLKYSNNHHNAEGKRVWGFKGIGVVPHA